MLENLKEDLASQVDELLGEVHEGYYEDAMVTLTTIQSLLMQISSMDDNEENEHYMLD